MKEINLKSLTQAKVSEQKLTIESLQAALDYIGAPPTKKELEANIRWAASLNYISRVIDKAVEMKIVTREQGLVILVQYEFNRSMSVQRKNKLKPAMDMLDK